MVHSNNKKNNCSTTNNNKVKESNAILLYKCLIYKKNGSIFKSWTAIYVKWTGPTLNLDQSNVSFGGDQDKNIRLDGYVN